MLNGVIFNYRHGYRKKNGKMESEWSWNHFNTQLEAETDSETLLTCSAWKDDWK